MQFSIIIPTFDNCDYLKLCINSIKNNSSYKHEIIVHINGSDQSTENFINENELKHTKTNKNVGLCTGVNLAAKKATTDYIVYAHDDMYFLPKWDFYLMEEIKALSDNLFYFSSTQLSHYPKNKGFINHIPFNAGSNLAEFNEQLLLSQFHTLKFHDLQGSHWAPHIIHKEIWEKIGGFSSEFDPGFGSDPDLNMKLWQHGVRIFKGVNLSRIYHFGSLTTRKKIAVVKNDGRKTFLLKWKISIDFFVKYYLRRGKIYNGKLQVPKKNLFFFLSLIKCKILYLLKKNAK